MNSQIRWGSKIQINETDISRFLINNPDLNARILIGLAIWSRDQRSNRSPESRLTARP